MIAGATEGQYLIEEGEQLLRLDGNELTVDFEAVMVMCHMTLESCQ